MAHGEQLVATLFGLAALVASLSGGTAVTDPHKGVTTEEASYGVSKLQCKEVTPHRLLTNVRTRWGIENGLHFRHDVTLGEDHSRIRLKSAVQGMTARDLVLVHWSRAVAKSVDK